jgi:DNA-binding NarL/FixJ family response regulator
VRLGRQVALKVVAPHLARTLAVSLATVQKHMRSIFHKLELEPTHTEHRRVLAVLAYLRDTPGA